jgi:hypothetical protein
LQNDHDVHASIVYYVVPSVASLPDAHQLRLSRLAVAEDDFERFDV